MKCSHIPCDKEGINKSTFDIGGGMIGEGYFCSEHTPKLGEDGKIELQ